MNNHSGFLELVRAPLKIISHNGKLMAITATIYLILYLISFILFTLSANPYIVDMTLKLLALASAQPGTPEFNELLADISKDTGIVFGIEAAYAVLFFFIALFAQTAFIITASCYYTGYDLSLKELILKVSKTWTRPFITSIWIQILALGYAFLFFFPFLVPSLVLSGHPTILFTVLTFLAILVITFYIYLSVVWSVGIVVSVIEDTYGYSALVEAKELVKGKRVHGFLLNLLFMVVMVVILVVGSKLSPAMPIVVGATETLLIGVISIFQTMAYSAFYFQCKNGMTKSGSFEYSRVPTAQVLDENLP